MCKKLKRRLKKYVAYVKFSSDVAEETSTESMCELFYNSIANFEENMKRKGYLKVGKIKIQPAEKRDSYMIWGRFIFVGKKRARELKPINRLDINHVIEKKTRKESE